MKTNIASNAKKIKLLTNSNPKKLEIIPGEDHRLSKNYKEVWKIALNWCKKGLISGDK